ncbi:dTDP-glucose 4,6-dehydratase [Actinoplanes sp. NPDC048967]|uniref:dTDP-glucose 4,6-dehydratase n=1 Tax=Actinoplanes sp. NPDC048967 TaxID=3155269 RepID=UPI0033CFE715
MRTLVAGGAGFIGSHYVRSLLSGRYGPDAEVTVLDKLTYAGNPANLAEVAADPRFRLVQGDITDTECLDRLLPGHDVVVNFAAETHVDRSIADAGSFVNSNVVGVHRLLEAVRKARIPTMIQVSTDEVYGSIDAGSWTEDDPVLPNSPYSASKASGDLMCRAYHHTYGLDVRVTRCSNTYGPFQYPEKVIPLFVTRLLDGGRVPLYGDGGNMRDWLHVDDHCDGVQTVLERGEPGEIYNIGGGTELSNRELTTMVLAECAADWSVVDRVTDRPGHDRRYSVDITKIKKLGYEPRTPLARGLADVVAWYRENRAWWQPAVAEGTPTTGERIPAC